MMTVTRQQIDVLPFRLTRQGGQSYPVQLSSDTTFSVLVGVVGGAGRNGEDGAAAIPDVIDGGNF